MMILNHTKRKEAAAILEKLFALQPNHPGVAHYLIHTYDFPGMAELGSTGCAAIRQNRSGRAPCIAYAVAYFCPSGNVAGRY